MIFRFDCKLNLPYLSTLFNEIYKEVKYEETRFKKT